MTPPALCEVCGHAIVVESSGEGTNCYWCRQCNAPRDPAGGVGAPVASAARPILRLPSGRGTRKRGGSRERAPRNT